MAPTSTRCPTLYPVTPAPNARLEFVIRADSLMSNREARVRRIFTVDDGDVGSANCGEAHLDDGIARSGFRNRLLLQWELFGVAKHDSLHCATSQLLSIVFFEFEKWHFSFVEQNAYMCKTVAKLRNSCRLSAGREGYGAFGGAALRHLTQPIRYFVIGLSPVRVI